MLRQLYFVEDIMERYRCRSKDTARRYMHQMGAKGSPLFVTEQMINAWEDSKGPQIKALRVKKTEIMKIPRRAV